MSSEPRTGMTVFARGPMPLPPPVREKKDRRARRYERLEFFGDGCRCRCAFVVRGSRFEGGTVGCGSGWGREFGAREEEGDGGVVEEMLFEDEGEVEVD